MTRTVWRRVRDVVISVAPLVLLLLALASLHGGLRTEVLRVLREASSSTMAVVAARARESAALTLRTAWDQASDYQVFAVFIVVAFVVFVCMLKLRPGR